MTRWQEMVGRLAVASALATMMSIPASVALAQSAASPVAPPQSSPQTPSETAQPPADIIVIGRDMPDILQIRRMARKITANSDVNQPIARFDTPVCLVASGLTRAFLQEIAERLLADALDAGIRLAGENCKPNVAIMFVNGDGKELALLRRRREDLFGDMTVHDMNALAKTPGPIHVLSNAVMRGADGNRLYIDSETGTPTVEVSNASSFTLPVRRDLLSSLILIDRKAALGLSSRQIADYAAMRAFAVVRPEGAEGGDTILTLFDPGGRRRDEMTDFDRGYLKALYAGSANQPPGAKLGVMARGIAHDLIKAPGK